MINYPAILLFLVLACSPLTATAHSQSSSRLALTLSQDSGTPQLLVVELALIDLLHRIDLDTNSDSQLTWSEVLASQPQIATLIAEQIQITDGLSVCRMVAKSGTLSFVRIVEVAGLRLEMQLQCPAASSATGYRLSDQLFFDGDPSHRALLHVTGHGNDQVHVLSTDSRELVLQSDEPGLSGARSFVMAGFRHILSGYDHLLFLLLLILPAAGSGDVRRRLLRIGAIVTAFTVAHSITLTASVLDVVHLPARPVEIAIAASIVIAALMNVFKPLNALGWKIAFAFGLLHGFGFAGALAELNLPPRAMWTGLLSFNIGIELGQLLVVALILPVLGLMTLSHRYQLQVVPAASFACGVLGVFWTAARY